MSKIKEGMTVIPSTGFWKGTEGKVIKVASQKDYPIEVQFEENETNEYYEEQLEIAMKDDSPERNHKGRTKLQDIYMHSLYRDFTGKLVYVIGEAREVTNGKYEEVVVYHELSGENELFTRSKEDFLGDVSEDKDNVTGQKHRFELFQDI